VKKKIFKIIKLLIRKSGIYKVIEPWYSGRGSILMFHRICKKEQRSKLKNNSVLEVTPEYLENIILYFKKKNYEPISIADVPERLKDRRANKFVVFTFDDGYMDNYSLAYPVFKKYNVPFTIYVTTSFPERTAVLWWYLIDDLVSSHDQIEIEYKGDKRLLKCGDASAKELAFIELKRFIMSGDPGDQDKRIEAIFGKYGMQIKNKTLELTLDWPSIEKMAKDPLVTIGAHTISHKALTSLDPDKLKNEIIGSKNIIGQKIGSDVSHFSYPFGGRDEAGPREFSVVKYSGFETATTTRMANIFEEHAEHPECLPRLLIDGNNENIWDLDLCVSGFIPFLINKGRRIVLE